MQQRLDRDEVASPVIERLVDDAHPAASDAAQDPRIAPYRPRARAAAVDPPRAPWALSLTRRRPNARLGREHAPLRCSAAALPALTPGDLATGAGDQAGAAAGTHRRSPSATPRPIAHSDARIDRFSSGCTVTSSTVLSVQATRTRVLSSDEDLASGAPSGVVLRARRGVAHLDRAAPRDRRTLPGHGLMPRTWSWTSPRGLCPVDPPVVLLEHRRHRRAGGVLRLEDARPGDVPGEPLAQATAPIRASLLAELLPAVSALADGRRDAGEGRSGVHALIELHQGDAGFRFSPDDRPGDRRGASVLRQKGRVHVHAAGSPGSSSTSRRRIRP